MLKLWMSPLRPAEENLAVADGEIERLMELERQYAELKANTAAVIRATNEACNHDLASHEATIKTMRDALIKCRAHIGDPANFDCYGTDRELAEFLQQVKRDEDSAIECADIVLSLPAPTDHLMAYRDEVLEEAAKVCERPLHFKWDNNACAAAIRAMKEKK